MDIIPYSKEYQKAWDEFVASAPSATISHLSCWHDIMEHGLGHRGRYLLAKDQGKIVGILPLSLVKTWWQTKYLISLPWIDYGGICAASPDAAKVLMAAAQEIARREKAEFIELRSVASSGLGLGERTDKVTFLLELNSDPEVVWKRFDAKLRNQIRKSQKSELAVEIGGEENIEPFYRVFCRNMRDLGTPVWGKRFFESILTYAPNIAKIILVKKEGDAIAGGLLLSFKDRLYVPSASSYRESLKFCPNHALYWAVIEKGCREGYQYFDFGRSTWNSDTFNFKKQWTPDPVQLVWQYSLHKSQDMPAINPDNPKYRLFIKTWRKLPLSVANFLGPKVIKNFP